MFVTQQGGQCGLSGTSKGQSRQSRRRGSQRNNVREGGRGESEGGWECVVRERGYADPHKAVNC